MSSILASELVSILNQHPDYEVVMGLHHKYDISKESGMKGWIAYINGYDVDDDWKEIRLMN